MDQDRSGVDALHSRLPVRARIRKQSTRGGRQRAMHPFSGKRARGENASLSSGPKSLIRIHSGHTGVLVWSHAYDNQRLICLSFRAAVDVSHRRNRPGFSVVRFWKSGSKSGSRPRRNSPQRWLLDSASRLERLFPEKPYTVLPQGALQLSPKDPTDLIEFILCVFHDLLEVCERPSWDVAARRPGQLVLKGDTTM